VTVFPLPPAISTVSTTAAKGQELLKAIEPGTGYSRMKQWAIEHRLLFENFTKDSLVIVGEFQEKDDRITNEVHILAKFCAGDDYAGRAFSTTLQQASRTDNRETLPQMFGKHRFYLEALAGKPSQEGSFPGNYTLRPAKAPDQKGVSAKSSSNEGSWELGMFLSEAYLTIQVLRSKEELCK
jgi:hypothetical protein